MRSSFSRPMASSRRGPWRAWHACASRATWSTWAIGNIARPTAASSSCPASTPTGRSTTTRHGARTIKPVTKIRGGDAKKYGAKLKANQWLIENVLGRLADAFRPAQARAVPAHRRSLPKVHNSRKRVGVASPLEAGRALDGAARRARRWDA